MTSVFECGDVDRGSSKTFVTFALRKGRAMFAYWRIIEVIERIAHA